MTYVSKVVAWFLGMSLLGAPRWMIAALAGLLIAENRLGRSKNPKLRSIAAVLATAINKLVLTLRIAAIPIFGPVILVALRAVTGTDDPPPEDPSPPPSKA